MEFLDPLGAGLLELGFGESCASIDQQGAPRLASGLDVRDRSVWSSRINIADLMVDDELRNRDWQHD